MNILFICKASVEEGLGHLIRCRSLATEFSKKQSFQNGTVRFIAVGHNEILQPLLLNLEYQVQIVPDEKHIPLDESFDYVIFDLLHIGDELFQKCKARSKYTVSISPIFNRMSEIDMLFHRTKFHDLPESELPPRTYMGLEYTIIQDSCKRINAGRFEENLSNDHFPIAVSMGGGDAANKTLDFLRAIKLCDVPATIWVMLGEGYQHSYDRLINETKQNRDHEIILAKTNRSMWQIMQNCVLGIFPGGITTYEAAYAGLPAINIYDHENQLFLIRELLDKGAAWLGGKNGKESFLKINEMIEALYANRTDVMNMHLKSKSLIDGKGNERIYAICLETLHA